MKTRFLNKLKTEEFRRDFIEYYKIYNKLNMMLLPRPNVMAELEKPGALEAVYDEVVSLDLKGALDYAMELVLEEQEAYGHVDMMEWFYCRFDNEFIDSIF